MKEPVAVDLFCGRGGWTRGLQAAGFYVIGVDMVRFPDYPGDEFIQADVCQIVPGRLPGGASLYIASPPCREFSKHSRAGLFDTLAPPSIACVAASLRLAQEAHSPIVLENVRGAEKWIGPAVGHYGPYFLWGDVPIMLPAFGPRRRHKSDLPDDSYRAMIPFELAYWIGRCFSPDDNVSQVRSEFRPARCGQSVTSSNGDSPGDNMSGAEPVLNYRVGTALEDFEGAAIEATIEYTRGDVNMAARLLGVTSRTLYRFLARKRLVIDRQNVAG